MRGGKGDPEGASVTGTVARFFRGPVSRAFSPARRSRDDLADRKCAALGGESVKGMKRRRKTDDEIRLLRRLTELPSGAQTTPPAMAR